MGYLPWLIMIASAKFWSARGASHRPAFMGSCLNISHRCLPCVPIGKGSPCVPVVIEGKEDAWGAVNVGCQCVPSVWNL